MISSNLIVQGISEILKAKNIKNIVISPGSRNAPFIIQFTEDSFFNVYSIVDERSAGFFAMGIIQQIENPVVINCTSGSAVTNYYPSIVESYYQGFPLIVITADRPKESIYTRENQTIQQENIFGKHVTKFVQLIEDYSKKGLWYNDYLINLAINSAFLFKKPVHINLPISEPLYNKENKISRIPKIITIPHTQFFSNFFLLNPYKKIWKNSLKKMILIGQQNFLPNLGKILKKLSKNDSSLIILKETLSNIHGNNFIESIDRLIYSIPEEKKQDLYPDLLITFGKNIISNKIKNFLKIASPKYHWHIEENIRILPDTYQSLTTYWNIPIKIFLKSLPKTFKNSDFHKKWIFFNKICLKKHKNFISKIDFCDLKAFSIILKYLPKKILLHLGNGTIIRYQQLFKRKKNVICYSNRGTCGIDGSVSTAIGAAVSCKKPLVLIIGDLSFFYDNNALWNSYTPYNLYIILINNGGGNTFLFISGPDKLISSKDYFVKNHNLNAESLCKMHQWNYLYADKEVTLKKELKKMWKPIKNKFQATLLELNTRNYNNSLFFRNYFSVFKNS